MNTKIIAFFGGSGSGKSTLASLVFSTLKIAGKSAELNTEYAKHLVWTERKKDFARQVYIHAKQLYGIECLLGKVEYVISDSPPLLSVFYHDGSYGTQFDQFVIENYRRLNTI